MAINPAEITTVRVGELVPKPWSLTDLLPHEVSTLLGQGTVQGLADLISSYIGTVSSLAFNPTTVNSGETLPVTDSTEWMFVGKGTFLNVGGGADIITTEELNVLVSNGTYWSLAVAIPIDVEFSGVVQTIRSGFTATVPSENAVYDALTLKLDKGGYTGTAQDLSNLINEIQTDTDISWGYVTAVNGGTRNITPEEDYLDVSGSPITNYTINLPTVTEAKTVYIAFDSNISNLTIGASGVVDYFPPSVKTYDTWAWTYEPVNNRWVVAGYFSGDLGAQISALPNKGTITDIDNFAISDGSASGLPKKVTLANLKKAVTGYDAEELTGRFFNGYKEIDDPETSSNSEPHITRLSNNNILMVYRKSTAFLHTGNDGYLAGKISTDEGVSWGAEFSIFNDAYDDRNYVLGVLPNNDVVVVLRRYQANTSTHVDIGYVKSSDNGATWGTYTIIENNVAITNEVPFGTLLKRGSDVYFASYLTESAVNKFRLYKSTNNFTSITNSVIVNSISNNAVEPVIVDIAGGKSILIARNNDYSTPGQPSFYQYNSSDGVTFSYKGVANLWSDLNYSVGTPVGMLYDSVTDDLIVVTTERKITHADSPSQMYDMLRVYTQKAEAVYSSQTAYSLKHNIPRPKASDYRFYGYPSLIKSGTGIFSVVCDASSHNRTPTFTEEAELYSFRIDSQSTLKELINNGISDSKVTINNGYNGLKDYVNFETIGYTSRYEDFIKMIPANIVTGTGTNGYISFWNSASTVTGDSGFIWDNTNKRLGIGTVSPISKLDIFTGTSGNNANVNSLIAGSIAHGNAATSNTVPSIFSKSADATGLKIISGTPNTNPLPDMELNVRQGTNVDYSTLTTPAFRFSRFGTALMEITRNGNASLPIGNLSTIAGVTANHVVIKSQLDLKADIASPALTGTPTAPTATAGTNTTQIATTAFVTTATVGVRPYKVYTALLSQTSTNAPIATVLENSLGGTVIWSRNSTGDYTATLSGAFQMGKSWGNITLSTNVAGYDAYITNPTANTMNLVITNVAGVLTEMSATSASIKFEVYP